MLIVASIVLTALCFSGCASHRKSVTAGSVEQVSETVSTDSAVRLSLDSVSELVEIRTAAVKVPMSMVRLTIATDSLRSLPSGASYSGRSGQASVKVSRKAATATEPERIYVYASCDSLQLQCDRYERTISNMRKAYGEQLSGTSTRLSEAKQEEKELKEKPPNGIGTALKWYLMGLVSGIIGTLITFIKLKK